MLAFALLALAGLQDDTVAAPRQSADGTQRWSILVEQPCAIPRGPADEIVVCAQGEKQPERLPLPAERGPPDHPVPSNRDLSGAGALAAVASPCATLSQGCTTGIDFFGAGTALVRGVGKLVDSNSCCEEPGEATNPVLLARDAWTGVKKIFRKKPDKSNRRPIPLDDPAPAEGAAQNPTAGP